MLGNINIENLIFELGYYRDLIVFLLLTLFLIVIIYLIKSIIAYVSNNFDSLVNSKINDIISEEIDKISWFYIVIISLFLSSKLVNPSFISVQLIQPINLIFWSITAVYIIRKVNKIISAYAKRSAKNAADPSIATAYSYVAIVTRFLLWILGILFVLANLGYDVNAFVAGLGITGLAIALALQNILKDLFSSFLIIFDKPIRVGEYVTVGGNSGTVKEIGIRTTKLSSPDGFDIIIPNGEIVATVVKNQRSRKFHNVVFTITAGQAKDLPKIRSDIFNVINIEEDVTKDSLEVKTLELKDEESKFRAKFILKVNNDEDVSDKVEKFLVKINNELSKIYKITTISIEN